MAELTLPHRPELLHLDTRSPELQSRCTGGACRPLPRSRRGFLADLYRSCENACDFRHHYVLRLAICRTRRLALNWPYELKRTEPHRVPAFNVEDVLR